MTGQSIFKCRLIHSLVRVHMHITFICFRSWASQYGVVFTDIPVFMTLAAFLFVAYNSM